MNTPTRVLFILTSRSSWRRVCSGAGKSCPRGRGRERETNRIQWTPHTTTEEAVEALPSLSVASRTMKAFLTPLPVCEPPTSASRPTTARFCRGLVGGVHLEALTGERGWTKGKMLPSPQHGSRGKAHVSTGQVNAGPL